MRKPKKKRKLLVVCPFSRLQDEVDELCEELREINKNPNPQYQIQPLIPRRKWNGKKQQRELVYRKTAPRDPYYAVTKREYPYQ